MASSPGNEMRRGPYYQEARTRIEFTMVLPLHGKVLVMAATMLRYADKHLPDPLAARATGGRRLRMGSGQLGAT